MIPLFQALEHSLSEVGSKARNLARLHAEGIPVPNGLVLAPGRPVPEAHELRCLGSFVAVRSSAEAEDGKGAAAPGVFHSEERVPIDSAQLSRAIAQVRKSGLSPLARAYCEAQGRPVLDEIPVILQSFQEGAYKGTLYSRAPGDPNSPFARLEVRDESGLIAIEVPRETATTSPGPLAASHIAQLLSWARTAESVFDHPAGVDIEWVATPAAVYLVQARPVVHPARRQAPKPHVFEFSRRTPGTTWHWDVTHNAGPLSPAQQALVERQVARGKLHAGLAGGYLYVQRETRRAGQTLVPEELWSLFSDTVLPSAEAALAPLEKQESPALDACLQAFDSVYDLYVDVLGPPLSAARATLTGEAPEHARASFVPLSPEDATAAAPAWDVAIPTYREQGIQPSHMPAPDGPPSGLAEVVARISEQDDRLFYRAQWLVRRALLQKGDALQIGDRIFYCEAPLAPTGSREELTAQANANQRALENSRLWHMPLAVRDGEPCAEAASHGNRWRGEAVGGSTVKGTVFRVDDTSPTVPPPGAVVVAPSILPDALALRGVRALVSEFDGLLGHTAALARELGVPCVVRCSGAWRDLRSGDTVLVDGHSGVVIRIPL